MTRLAQGLDVKPLLDQLDAAPWLWGEIPNRSWANSPHRETTDIWARYMHPALWPRHDFTTPHESVWLPAIETIPAIRDLHAKVAVVDCCWATVGSSNIDPFSLLLAREANILVADAGFASELRGSLENAILQRSQRMQKKNWDEEPLLRRAATWASYGIARILVGAIGYAGWH